MSPRIHFKILQQNEQTNIKLFSRGRLSETSMRQLFKLSVESMGLHYPSFYICVCLKFWKKYQMNKILIFKILRA